MKFFPRITADNTLIDVSVKVKDRPYRRHTSLDRLIIKITNYGLSEIYDVMIQINDVPMEKTYPSHLKIDKLVCIDPKTERTVEVTSFKRFRDNQKIKITVYWQVKLFKRWDKKQVFNLEVGKIETEKPQIPKGLN